MSERDPLQLPNLEAMVGAQTEARVGMAEPAKGPPSAEEKTAATEIRAENNPSLNWRERMERERGPRIAMNTPERRLETHPIEGYHQHWFLSSNIPKAIQAWYEFVTPEEARVNDRSIGGRAPGVSSEDLGGGAAQVSQIGGVGQDGRPEYLVLMKIRNELYFEDQRKIAERNLSIIKQIFHKRAPLRATELNESDGDYDMRYTREALLDMSNGRFVNRA